MKRWWLSRRSIFQQEWESDCKYWEEQIKVAGLLARKVGMTQIFDEEGNAIPVTLLELFENTITEIRTIQKHGYAALQVGAIKTKEYKLSKAEIGHCTKNEIAPLRLLREFRTYPEITSKFKIGDQLSPSDVLGEDGSLIDITSNPIGKGTRGRIKRWNQRRRPMGHGSKHHRQQGSIGPGTDPGRVFKGMRMGGRDHEEVTLRKLTLVKFDSELNVLVVKGAVPGFNGAILAVKPSVKKGEWNQHAVKLGKRKA
ncbi:MAG: 50S ribosomal protein L3 [Candidatus Caenarcaniphilales bacterium]|nr:50S ribosomal protein L3 [Candidatus Caenarcaniphilales bacterium]